MKILFVLILTILSSSAFALDPYTFSCTPGGVAITSIPGVQKAPVSPVVSLNIKVIQTQVQLYLIKATVAGGADKNLFATDWVSPTQLSPDGNNLMSLLSLFFNVDVASLVGIRAALPTDLLDGFAYLELKDKSGSVMKLGFQGSTPSTCQ